MRDEELQQLRISIQNISGTWFHNRRPKNAGGVGNTLEDLLGGPEQTITLNGISIIIFMYLCNPLWNYH